MERRLGRGLSSLLADPDPAEQRLKIPVGEIRPNRHQPRRTFDPEALEELTQSIRRHGVLQPIVLRRATEGFELISGERRWRASQRAGLDSVPAVVRDGVSDEEMLELALVENLQRVDLDPIERALGYQGLMKSFELTQEEVAQHVGLKRSTVANHLRLLDLPPQVQQALSAGALSMGHARALLGLRAAGRQVQLMEQTIRQQLSVRDIERRVREIEKPAVAKAPASPSSGPAQAPWIREVEERLRQALGTKVSLTHEKDYQGSIRIDYFDREGLDRLIETLAPAARVQS